MFIRYKEMKIWMEKLKSWEKLEKRFFDESSAYCCNSEDSSRLTANFEARYFLKKSKYDWEKMFEQYYSFENSAINFVGDLEVIYNFEKFSWKYLPIEFMGVK